MAFAKEERRGQLSSSAAAWFALHEHLVLGIDFVAPLGGPLGGFNYSGELSLTLGW